MKAVAFSDTHGQHRSKYFNQSLENIEAYIAFFTGDHQANGIDSGEDFVDWLESLPYKYKICTFGNHDFNYERTKEYSEKFKGIFFLNNESITIGGIHIFGSPYSLPFGNWEFMQPENVLEEFCNKIPENTDVLLTHGAPYGILDKTYRGTATGSKSFLNASKRLNNRFHIFGHIHEGYGIQEKYGKTFINCSILDERYRLKNDPVVFEL